MLELNGQFAVACHGCSLLQLAAPPRCNYCFPGDICYKFVHQT